MIVFVKWHFHIICYFCPFSSLALSLSKSIPCSYFKTMKFLFFKKIYISCDNLTLLFSKPSKEAKNVWRFTLGSWLRKPEEKKSLNPSMEVIFIHKKSGNKWNRRREGNLAIFYFQIAAYFCQKLDHKWELSHNMPSLVT